MSSINQLASKLKYKLTQRHCADNLRKLNDSKFTIDFDSNDYLGLAQDTELFNKSYQHLKDHDFLQNGSSGSRLLSGNHQLFKDLESLLSKAHLSESALIFNSGYDANLGLLSCVPQRNDIVLYDKLSHASIRDGLKLSNAKSISFDHNNLYLLEQKLTKYPHTEDREIYIVTESVFSMDGDSPDLSKLVELAQKYNAKLIIDEAHALGVFGFGLIQSLNLQDKVFARIITFGKALGCHGAMILGSKDLVSYLVNFARSFIYTTALAPTALSHIKMAYGYLTEDRISLLKQNIKAFKQTLDDLNMSHLFIESNSAIQSCIISGNESVKFIASELQKNNFSVKPILSPTVPNGQERLRFCIHSYNSEAEIISLLKLLKITLNSIR